MKSRLKYLIADREQKLGRAILQKDIAEATNLRPNTISRWMQPRPLVKIEAETVKKLCEYFDCEIGELLYLDRGAEDDKLPQGA